MKLKDYGIWTRILETNLLIHYRKGHLSHLEITTLYPEVSMYIHLNDGHYDEIFIKRENGSWAKL